MSSTHADISPALAEWIHTQHMFFVGTAPLAEQGHINVSPKGGQLRVLSPLRVAYADVTGSGAEGIAHLRENRRIVIMLCAFTGAPRIVRLHGQGTVILPNTPSWNDIHDGIARSGQRAYIDVAVTRVSSSCGMGVPRYDFHSERDELDIWATAQGDVRLDEYRRKHNQHSIDGLNAYPQETL
jgi:hypothetical protein